MGPQAAGRKARRDFLRRGPAWLAALAWPWQAMAAGPPPETRTVRLVHSPTICLAPQYLAEAFLRLEGFTEVVYVPQQNADDPVDPLLESRADFTQDAPMAIPKLVPGAGVFLAGIHAGCYELFAHEDIRSLRDLRGRRIAISRRGGAEHLFIASMLGYVGLNPDTDAEWLPTQDFHDPMRLFLERKADAFIGFPPQPQELRARNVGHVLVDTALDRPWSHYFCCLLAGRRAFVERYPVATKRVLRAFLMAADLCAREPERAAALLKARGYVDRETVGLEVLKKLPFDRWREADPASTIRFYALRLYEAGILRATPNQVLATCTDWRFLNALKQEMKT